MSENNQENNYGGEQIKVLKGLEAVRKRPAMYIGNTAVEGLHHLIYEVVDNSIDEAMAGFCTEISVTIHEDDSVTVEDNGRGIPVDIHPTEKISSLELVMTTLHAGGKFDNSSYKVSGGLHGVGVSVVNALSTRCEAIVVREGQKYRQSYACGVREGDVEKLGPAEGRGTTVHFSPDPEIFTETTVYNYETVKTRMRELAFLNRNLRINLKDERDGAEDSFYYEGGIISYVEYLNRNRTAIHPEPIYLGGEKDNVQVEVCLQFLDDYKERIHSFANNINTREGGTHVTGFRYALTSCVKNYAAGDSIPKNLKEDLEGEDMSKGLTCIVSVRVPNPQFEAQTKVKLGNSEVTAIVRGVCTEKLNQYFEQNPNVARAILGKIVEAARVRVAVERAAKLARQKGNLSLSANKLMPCQSKKPEECEIFIVEGDSAGGSARQGRNSKIQAILPLRGKILNVEKARFDQVLGSDEIRQLVVSLGTGIGDGKDGFDLTKLRYHKVIIMTDADVDGAHIRSLLLTFFFRQMQPLIENGHIYIGQPPLYRLSKGKKEQYFLDDEALNNYLYSQASATLSLAHKGKNTLEAENMVAMLRDLSSFARLLEYLAHLNIPEELVLFLLANKVQSARQFEDRAFVEELAQGLREKNVQVTELVPCSWRPACFECEVSFPGHARLASTMGPGIPLATDYRRAVSLYKNIAPYLEGGFTLTRISSENRTPIEAASWRELLALVRDETFRGSHLQRYKGLGEMNAEQLWDTAMNPETRSLIQVRIDDMAASDDMFTTLMGDKVEPRRDFIQNNALAAVDLDI